MDRFVKQPYEEFPIAGDFEDVLESGEALVLASCDIVAEDKDGGAATDTVLDIDTKAVSGSQLKVLVKSGSASASPYKITFKGVTDNDYKWEIDVEMIVIDI